jgi:hypothetical protein
MTHSTSTWMDDRENNQPSARVYEVAFLSSQ